MGRSSIQTFKQALLKARLPDRVSVRRWFAAYGTALAAACAVLVIAGMRDAWTWRDWRYEFVPTFTAAGTELKLLGLGIYASLCCTFLPLPTGWIVSAVAMREAAVGAGPWTTTLLVATVGAVGSTVANLNDYHLFTWMLRSRGVSRVRKSRTYRAAAKWFATAPFLILVTFNLIPIPVDVIRMLATTFRYPRVPFAAANFIGRFVRYGIIAFVTYYWNLSWVAPAVLLGLAGVLGIGRLGPVAARRLREHFATPAVKEDTNA